MANVARAIEQAATRTVDENLWWDSHESVFSELDKFVSSSARDGALSPSKATANELAQKLLANHSWLLDTLLRFKPPSANSRSALDVARVVLGGHTLEINSEMKNVAVQLSTKLVLDEVQTYILVSRFFESEAATSLPHQMLLQKITLKYYRERQCLLKCTRLILLFQMAEESDILKAGPINGELKQLVKDGLEDRVIIVLKQLLTVEQHPHLDMDSANLWAEETVMEQTLVMDILFLLYYEPLSSCKAARWKELFLMFQERIFVGPNVENLSLTTEAEVLVQHVKHQAILIIVEALDLDKLLKMVFDDVAFSQGGHSFSFEELQQIDGLVAGINPLEAPEYGPLLVGWATFLCLVSFLPLADEEPTLMDIDHTAYMRQAYKGGAYKYLLNMVHSQGFQESDAQIDGYKCVVKILLAAFLAAYDVANENDSGILDILVDIFYAIYSGQEALCIEFWDRESVLDGPIRNLLFSLRDYFPYRLTPLARLLSGLSEGPWPAECVYDFLYSMVEITSLYQHPTKGSVTSDNQVVQTIVPLQVPGAPGLLIPAGSYGHIIRAIDGSTSLVRWECKHSGIIVLLFRLTDLSTSGHSCNEVHTSLNLLSRMLSSNKMLAELLLELDCAVASTIARSEGRMEGTARINFLSITCALLNSLLEVSGDVSTVVLCIDILGIFSLCWPIKVMSELSRTTLLQPARGKGNYMDGGLLVKSISKMILDSEQTVQEHILVVSVLDLCTTLVGKGIQSESFSMTVIHIISNLLVDHTTWKYKQKYERWQISTKVFQLAHTVVTNSHPNLSLLKTRVLEVLLVDTSIHDVILQILSTTAEQLEDLYVNRYVHVKEIEWFEQALGAGLTLLHEVLSNLTAYVLSKDYTGMTQLEHALLHRATGAMPFVRSLASLLGFSRNPALQIASAKSLLGLCLVAQRARPHPISISSYIPGIEQRRFLRTVFGQLLSKEIAFSNSELFNATVDLLTTAARCQPSFVELIFSPIKDNDGSVVDTKKNTSKNVPLSNTSKQTTMQKEFDCEALEGLWKILEQAKSLSHSHPEILSRILFLLKSLWQGGIEFPGILEVFRDREGFWKHLATSVSIILSSPLHPGIFVGNTLRGENTSPEGIMSTNEMLVKSFQYQCQASALHIMACDTFLQHYIVRSEGAAGTNQTVNGHVSSSNSDMSRSKAQLPLLRWSEEDDPSKIILSYATCLYDKQVLVRAKAETRALSVGLMLKVLSDDEVGLSASLIAHVQDALKAVLDHPSFQELLAHYSAHGYGYGKELQVLLMSDLYFHLQGELEAGRHIPAGSFQHLVEFLDSMELDSLMHPTKQLHIEGLHPPFGDGFIYDTLRVGQHLGLEWWSQRESHVLPGAESALHAMQCANGMACLGASQLSALEALTNLLIVLSSDKQVVDSGPAPLNSMWTESSIRGLCTALETSVALLGPVGDPTNYMPKFLATQAQLLLILVQWFSTRMADDFSKTQVGLICVKVVRTIVGCLRPTMGSWSAVQSVQEALVRSFLGSFLICLELVQTRSDEQNLCHKAESKSQKQNDGDAFVDVALMSMGFLPVLCSFVEIKQYANLSVATIGMLIKHFLAPSTWLPILQKHFPIRLTLTRLRIDEGTDSAYQALNLFLSLSHVRGGADMLQSAGFFAHIMLFSQQLKEDIPFTTGEMEGPFCVWKRRVKKKELWGLGVAIVAAAVRSLGEKDGGTAVENALVYFDSQKDRLLCALRPPSLSDTQGKKKARYQRPQTTVAALQETQHVIYLMIELVHHQVQWSHVLQRSAVDFREMCIHLLAYIAREGLVRNISSGAGTYLRCPPMQNGEMLAHSKPSVVGCSTGWFAVTARGSTPSNKFNGLEASSQNSIEPNGILPSSASVVGKTGQCEVAGMVLMPTQYSDSVAVHVYRVALLLLEFLCKQAQQAVKRPDEAAASDHVIFPEFPAPEILYGLQDQVISVITELCSRTLSKAIDQQAQQVCWLLLSIMEKALYLEVCVSRICGIGPLSLRSEDFLKEYKTLLAAVQGHQFLDAPLKALKSIVGLAYPALQY